MEEGGLLNPIMLEVLFLFGVKQDGLWAPFHSMLLKWSDSIAESADITKERVLSGLLISSVHSQTHQTIATDQSGIILNTILTLPVPRLASLPLL